MSEFEKELKELINRHSMENDSNTPDWILAQYLSSCLSSFAEIIRKRENWYKGTDKDSSDTEDIKEEESQSKIIKNKYTETTKNITKQYKDVTCHLEWVLNDMGYKPPEMTYERMLSCWVPRLREILEHLKTK